MARRDERFLWLGDVADGIRLVARLVATVDLDRALADLGRGDPAGENRFVVADRAAVVEDPLLGARVVVLTDAAGERIALAEPSTEGRLAATLARHGEGQAGAYWRLPVDVDVVVSMASARDVSLSQPETGPFGRSVLILGERFASSHDILVDPTAVPSRP